MSRSSALMCSPEPPSEADVRILDTPPVAVTLFEDHLALTGREIELELDELAERVRSPECDPPGRPGPSTWCFIRYTGGRRGTPVESLSALVLEYEATALDGAALRRAWSRWAFVAYSDPDRSRWYLVLPLAEPVAPERHRALLEWARRRVTAAAPSARSEDLETPWPTPTPGERYGVAIHTEAEVLDARDALKALAHLRARAARRLEIERLSRELSGAPSLARYAGEALLARSQRRRRISLAALPGRPGGSLCGYGLGPQLDAPIGGLRPGSVLAITAEGAAIAGRDPATALALQLADGLALRTAAVAKAASRDALSPVMLIAEGPPEQLILSTLARWTGADLRTLEAGGSARSGADQRAIFQAARDALSGHLGRALGYLRVLQSAPRGSERLAALRAAIATWRALLERQSSREVWPVVAVSPAVTLAPGELEALIATGRSLGWVLILAGDAESIPGDRVDARIQLTRRASTGDVVALDARVLSDRREAPGARLHWFPRSGRVGPPQAGAAKSGEHPRSGADAQPRGPHRPEGARRELPRPGRARRGRGIAVPDPTEAIAAAPPTQQTPLTPLVRSAPTPRRSPLAAPPLADDIAPTEPLPRPIAALPTGLIGPPPGSVLRSPRSRLRQLLRELGNGETSLQQLPPGSSLASCARYRRDIQAVNLHLIHSAQRALIDQS